MITFKPPVLHNLSPDDIGYKECQAYNKLIGNKPTSGMNLQTKIENQRAWELECDDALQRIKDVLNSN